MILCVLIYMSSTYLGDAVIVNDQIARMNVALLAARLDVLQRVRHLLQLLLGLGNLLGQRLVEVALLGDLLIVLGDRMLAGARERGAALVQAPLQVGVVALGLMAVVWWI